MNKVLFGLLVLNVLNTVQAKGYLYAPGVDHPFGQYNPSAPVALKGFEPMIGQAQCQSYSRLLEGVLTCDDLIAMMHYPLALKSKL